MHIDDIEALVKADITPLRRDLTDWEASRSAPLHAKYRRLLRIERIELDRMLEVIKPLLLQKNRFYQCHEDNTEYLGKPFGLVLKPNSKELIMYVEADAEVIAVKDTIIQQRHKVEYLESIVTEISKRSFYISNIINAQRFAHGLENLGQTLQLIDPDHD